MQGRSTLVIAHRLSTVRNASKIIALDEGRVVEQGTHRELLAFDGLYSHLVASQMVSRPDDLPLAPAASSAPAGGHGGGHGGHSH
jgi:ABC-type microcin C transport system duplicated ATPase subunit YejF